MVILGSGNNSLDTRVFNAGIGLKFLYTSGMAMKLEINYKNYSYSTSNSYGDQYYHSSSNVDGDMNVLSLSIGFSILL